MLSFKAVRQAIRVVFLLVACSLLTLSQGALAAGKEGAAGVVAGDIVSAGRLRMQSQRLAKLNQQAGMGSNATQAMQQITVSAGEIDSEFGRLGASVKKPNVRRVLTRCDALWQEMRAALKQAPGPASAERVNQLADELMIHTGKLSRLARNYRPASANSIRPAKTRQPAATRLAWPKINGYFSRAPSTG